MFQRIAIAVGAGLASALLFVVPATRAPIAMALAFVGPLPIMIAGLGFGPAVGLSAAFGTAQLPGVPLTSLALAKILGLRLLATSACVWTGTIGGVFTPTLFLGGALGSLVGHLAPGSPSVLWAVAGMSCIMPSAPAGLAAPGSNWLSCRATASRSAGSGRARPAARRPLRAGTGKTA